MQMSPLLVAQATGKPKSVNWTCLHHLGGCLPTPDAAVVEAADSVLAPEDVVGPVVVVTVTAGPPITKNLAQNPAS